MQQEKNAFEYAAPSEDDKLLDKFDEDELAQCLDGSDLEVSEEEE